MARGRPRPRPSGGWPGALRGPRAGTGARACQCQQRQIRSRQRLARARNTRVRVASRGCTSKRRGRHRGASARPQAARTGSTAARSLAAGRPPSYQRKPRTTHCRTSRGSPPGGRQWRVRPRSKWRRRRQPVAAWATAAGARVCAATQQRRGPGRRASRGRPARCARRRQAQGTECTTWPRTQAPGQSCKNRCTECTSGGQPQQGCLVPGTFTGHGKASSSRQRRQQATALGPLQSPVLLIA